MRDTNKNIAEIRRFAKILGSLVTLSVLIAGCTGYERMSKQTVDQDYTVLALNWQKGESTLIVLKAFKSENRLAVCGSRTRSGGSDSHGMLEEQFFNQASVVIDGEDIGPLAFISRVPRSGLAIEENTEGYAVKQWSGKANCVRTETPWRDDYLEATIDFRGPNRVSIRN